MMSGEHGLFFGGGFMWIVWIVLILGLVYVVKNILSGNTFNKSSSDMESPKDILDKRLARGEINEEEYRRLCDQLER